MLTSLALVFLSALLIGSLFKKIHLPALLGMLLTGIILGPSLFNVLDPSLLAISGDLRQLALIIILTRAGLALDLADLKEVGRPAFFLSFLPASFEILGVLLLGPWLLGISRIEAAIMGSVLAAVSPAVVVPKMLHLMDHGLGTGKRIPQMIMAGASVDDVFVIVLFTVFTGMARGQEVSLSSLAGVPVAILLGIGVGMALGFGLSYCFKRISIRDTTKVLILVSLSFLLVALEDRLEGLLPFSGLLAVMAMGTAIQKSHFKAALRLSVKFSKLWVAAEIVLFVLVGAAVDINYALAAGGGVILLIFLALLFRMLGVWLSLMKTRLNTKEKCFCMLAYCPKATVQAAIGPLPLAMGLASGSLILTTAVLAILMTAPLFSFLMDMTSRRWLTAIE